MYDLYPYFTNDGSVGLFSQQDDDIYHSTYGALTESWQKFIIPSHLEDFLRENSDVKILDICYGIGYNTKTALNVFVKNIYKNKNKSCKIFNHEQKNIAPIYTDNISQNINIQIQENLPDFSSQTTNTIEAIDANNIIKSCDEKKSQNDLNTVQDSNLIINHSKDFRSSILIDTVDIDRTLIGLSPFIRISTPKFMWFRNKLKHNANHKKFAQVKKIQDSKSNSFKKELKLKKEVPLIIFLKLVEQKFKFDDKILQTILARKEYSQFLSRFMLNFANFYSNQGCNYNKNKNILAFLHNIYYRHVSRSYKKVKNLIENHKIDLNFHTNDARAFIQTSNYVYDFIFLDAFTPSKCPSLWTIEFMQELYKRLNHNGMILTYSNSAAIRNAFFNAGFNVGKIYDKTLKKFVGTIAVKNSDHIEYPLDEQDLALIYLMQLCITLD